MKRKVLEEGNTGIRWRFTQKLEDLDFADDLALLSSTRRQLQLKNHRRTGGGVGGRTAAPPVTKIGAIFWEKY